MEVMAIIKVIPILENIHIQAHLFIEVLIDYGMIKNSFLLLMISIILLSCKEKSYFIYRDIETKKYKIYFYTIGNTTNASFKDSLVVYDKTKETIIFKEGSYGYRDININNEDTLKVYISYYIDDAEKINIVDKNLVIKFIKDYDKKKPRPRTTRRLAKTTEVQ